MEKSIQVNEHTLAILLDTDGGFSNVDLDAIVKALGSLLLGQFLVRFIELLLKYCLQVSRTGWYYPGGDNYTLIACHLQC